MKIDKNIRALVKALNGVPGVTTFSSCGGHAKPAIVSQRPAGCFFVAFNLTRSAIGWRALGLIAKAIAIGDVKRLSLIAWLSGTGVDSLAFQVDGWDGTNPDLLAAILSGLSDSVQSHGQRHRKRRRDPQKRKRSTNSPTRV